MASSYRDERILGPSVVESGIGSITFSSDSLDKAILRPATCEGFAASTRDCKHSTWQVVPVSITTYRYFLQLTPVADSSDTCVALLFYTHGTDWRGVGSALSIC